MATGEGKGSSGIPERDVLKRVRQGEKDEGCQYRGTLASSGPAPAVTLPLFSILLASASQVLLLNFLP